MKAYRGSRSTVTRPGMAVIMVHDLEIGTQIHLHHVVRHSPTGMEWGYGGSGPSDTALSILTDHLGDALEASYHYQDFKFAFLCDVPGDGFEINSKQIDDWLRERGYTKAHGTKIPEESDGRPGKAGQGSGDGTGAFGGVHDGAEEAEDA
jgi:hypothetical protein